MQRNSYDAAYFLTKGTARCETTKDNREESHDGKIKISIRVRIKKESGELPELFV